MQHGILVREPVHGPHEDERRVVLPGRPGREVREIDAGRNRAHPGGRCAGRKQRGVLLRHGDGQRGTGARPRLGRAQLAPLDFEEGATPGARLDPGQPPPDQVLHVVREEERRHGPRQDDVRRADQEVRYAQIDRAPLEAASDLLAQPGNDGLQEIDRLGREPGARERQGEPGASPLGKGIRNRHDLAPWQVRQKRAGVLAGRVRCRQTDVVAPRQLRHEMQAPQPPASVGGPKTADFDPENPHERIPVSIPAGCAASTRPSRTARRCQSDFTAPTQS